MNAAEAVETEDLRKSYGARPALAGVGIRVHRGEIFALLGPNGGGKTTLFRILATLLPPDGGRARLLGHSVETEPAAVRRRIGVVFQHPSLDPKLTVTENLLHHGHLYGMRGRGLRDRAAAGLDRLGLGPRQKDRAETLSGGLQRRVELAKAMLPEPEVLLLDEPSSGLDPGARIALAGALERLRSERGTTVLLTTHIMEEADRCDRVGIIHEGRIVALGPPDALKEELGGDVLVLHPASDPTALKEKIEARFGCAAALVEGTLRIEREGAHEFIAQVVEAFPGEVKSLHFGRPTLEDVFIRKTGRRFWEEGTAPGGGA